MLLRISLIITQMCCRETLSPGFPPPQVRSVCSGPGSQSPTSYEATVRVSCSFHPEGLGPSACASPNFRKPSGGQSWSEVPWENRMVSALKQEFIWPGTVSVLEENRSSPNNPPHPSLGRVSSEKNWANSYPLLGF